MINLFGLMHACPYYCIYIYVYVHIVCTYVYVYLSTYEIISLLCLHYHDQIDLFQLSSSTFTIHNSDQTTTSSLLAHCPYCKYKYIRMHASGRWMECMHVSTGA